MWQRKSTACVCVGGGTHFCSPPSHKDKLQCVVFSQNLLIAQNVHLKNITKVKVAIKKPTPPTAKIHVITLQSIKKSDFPSNPENSNMKMRERLEMH